MDPHDGRTVRSLPRGFALGALMCAVSGAQVLACDGADEPGPYASELVSFSAGPGAGFGQSRLPEVVLGPPVILSPAQGSTDVLSLGRGGEVVLGFSGRTVVDGPGADLIVFENAFFIGGDPSLVFAELGEVSVSMDGQTWAVFPCGADGEGCAGQTPGQPHDATAPGPLDPSLTGGDAFDLAEVGLAEARWVRIRDLGTGGEAPSAGFDLDAVGAVHFAP